MLSQPRLNKRTFPLIFLAAFPPGMPAAESGAWSDESDIYLDTSPSGINLETRVVDFPLLVRLRTPDFPFDRARGQGQDIRFTNDAGAALPYQIERWDSAGGQADIWVLVDTVHASSATQRLRMRWGNPSASDASNPGAVFSAARGLMAVWHLGEAGTAPRPNAVAGGNPAVPVGYEGDEVRPGIIGLADSLDGGAPGDYLDAGAGYADFSQGFTYSAWVKPTAVKAWSRLMDFGNGEASHNIILGRDVSTDNLAVHIYPGVGQTHSRLQTGPFFTLNQWHHVAVTINPVDSVARAYRNGSLVWTGKLIAPISAIQRTSNWLGRSHWAADQYWQGLYDEVRIAGVVEDPARIRLSYESQRPDQSLVTFVPRSGCQESFAAPADTVAAEGSAVDLAGVADCASSYSWSAIAGLPVRILDPGVKTLTIAVPRVAGDTSVTLQFTATFPAATRQAQVEVRIREAVPEPLFTLPDSLDWNGRDSLVISPAFTNLAAIRASPDSILYFAWTVSGMILYTAWRGQSLVVRGPADEGSAEAGLCVNNRGPATCRKVRLQVREPTALRAPRQRPSPTEVDAERRRLDGRLAPLDSRRMPAFPLRK
jgi:hypothetical protein